MTLLRLALASAVVLAPGWAVARALSVRSVSATLAWALTILFGALAFTFLVGGSISLTLLLLLATGVVALIAGRRRVGGDTVPGRWWVFAAGAILGVALWHVAGEIGGDGLFHLARVRKLDAFGSLSLDSVDEFPDGGLHPGYAFPLWHAFLALVARVGFLDPADVVLHEASVLAPLALLVTYEAAWALFRRVGPATAAVCAQVAITALAPNGGGAYTALGLPATASRQLLVPAALALAFAAIEAPSRALLASAAAGGLVLAVVHPTYALFLWLPFAGFVLVRSIVRPREAKPVAAAFAALVVPAGLFLAWLLPVIRDTRSVSPGSGEIERAVEQYRGQLDVHSATSYRLAPEVFGRAGALAVAALVAVPLAGFALQRRWAAYVLGGSLVVLGVLLIPAVFVPFSDAVSLSQSRRAAGFVPFAFAFAGGLAVLGGLLRAALLPLALGAGIALQLAYAGDFGYRLHEGGPALATWIAVAGGLVALAGGFALGALDRRGRNARRETRAYSGLVAVAALLFVLPVGVHAAWNWSPSDARQPSPLTEGLVAALRRTVPEGATVYSDLETSYRIAAAAPVYIAAAPPSHVADTAKNDPYARRQANIRFFRTGDLSIPRRAGAGWIVVDRKRFALMPGLDALYRDERYTLYHL